ncbi:MAG: type II toxin-antitoxin system RelE/ParE family toxin [Oscillospiraceae bacterium]|nr:type II toxin-antitoxin system RelE/ParE family toxin [Oscillospiraceae bacterium]
MGKIEVIFYDTPNGDEPAREFLDSLDKKMQAKMVQTIAMLRDYGWELREPFSKALESDIFELRAKQGSNITRVMYFFVVGNKAILTHGFIKKTQKTPPREIERAKRYRKEFLERTENRHD